MIMFLFAVSFAYGADTSKPVPVPTTVSVDYVLPYAGILPDHPLYLLKVLRDRIVDLFTNQPEKRVNFLLLMADKRLVMGELLVEKGNADLGHTTISKGENYFIRSASELSILRDTNKESAQNLEEKLEKAYLKHKEVVLGIESKLNKNQKKQWNDVDQKLAEIGSTLGVK